MGYFSILLKCLSVTTLFFALFNCSNKLPSEIDENNTPSEIIKLGDEAYAKGYFARAGDYYSEVNKYFPYSIDDEAGLSKAVDAYFRARKFEDSRLAASKFLMTYPQSNLGQRVLYFRSKSFCEEIDIVERDQAAARECISSFLAFKDLYPNSSYNEEANYNLKRAKEFLVGQQLSVGKYYLKRNNPTAAMRRFKKLKGDTKVSEFLPEVSYRLIESFLLIGLLNEAILEKKYMKKNFPGNRWSIKAATLIEKSGLN